MTKPELSKSEILKTYIPVTTSAEDRLSCVDGRPAKEFSHLKGSQEIFAEEQGPQLLGGDALFAVLKSINSNSPLTTDVITSVMTTLGEAGFKTGLHNDEHAHGENCGCGFCDKLKVIVQRAKDKQAEITALLVGLDPKLMPGINTAYSKLAEYNIENIQTVGAEFVNTAKMAGAGVETVLGDHGEKACVVNLVPLTTLNRQAMNEQQGVQYFNLDLWAVEPRAITLGLDSNLSMVTACILFAATEMVLVEDKGKPQLPVVIRQ